MQKRTCPRQKNEAKQPHISAKGHTNIHFFALPTKKKREKSNEIKRKDEKICNFVTSKKYKYGKQGVFIDDRPLHESGTGRTGEMV